MSLAAPRDEAPTVNQEGALGQSEFLTGVDGTAEGRYVMKKLPEVTLAFWIMKIAATTLPEHRP
ncbi:hypothetical protein [Streptomyces sp. NBC_01750]|uniref:hypothetical protein n=1 Tax=Streptomyces sp. NBC_01750 TaxID=2975928 RepID=UPI002DDB952D|nr:hypothetical protein [Streptomyces sp. NBC_01750]WSD30916.1 hypothetical protein OG966_02545 [Streptomyces sp. NBC_01750]